MASLITVPNSSAPNPVDAAPPASMATPTLVQDTVTVEEADPIKLADSAVAAVINAKQPPRFTMQNSMGLAVGTNPDSEAEARKIAAATGVPTQTVLARPEEMKRKATLDNIDFKNYESLYPVSAAVLSNLEFAKIAHDDTENLGGLENEFNTWRTIKPPEATAWNTAAALGQSLETGADLTRQGIRQQFADAFDWAAMSEDAQRRAAQSRFRQELVTPKFESSTAQGAYSGAQSLVQMVPALAGAIITRNPTLVLGAAGLQTETEAYTRYRERGATPGQAALGAVGEGAIEVVTEKLPMGVIVDKFGKVGAKRFLGEFLGKELVGEEIATFTQDAIDTAIANPNKTWGDFLAERPEAAYQTAIATLVAAGTVTATQEGFYRASGQYAIDKENAARQRTIDNLARATKAQQDSEAIARIDALAAQSKVRTRDPIAFQNFINDLTKTEGAPENLYVDPRALAQSGISLDALAQANPSMAAQARVALETGTDVKIPVSEYATTLAGTELGQVMLDHVKTDPLGMSRAESQVFFQDYSDQLKTDVEKALQEYSVDETFNASANVVRQDVLNKLSEARRFTNDVNEQYATLMSSFYKVQAARMGVAPEQLYAQHPVNIQSTFDPGQTLSLKQAGNGDSFFEESALKAAREQNEKSRDKLIYMHPQDFLDVATTGTDKVKSERVKGLVESGTKFNDVPYLGFTHDGEGTAQVTGHEGRHRARELLARGVTEMPVVLSHRYDENGQAMRWGELEKDFKDTYPKTLYAQVGGDTASSGNKGKNIDFPVADPRELKQGEMVARGSFNPETNVITLLRNADLSTFLHESGHFFLETMNKLAMSENAPDAIKQDMQAVFDWLGVKDIKEWNSHDLEWQREKHEQFARGFEAYLFEGKSPSVEMRGVFQRFRAWMLNVYRQLSALNVELSPEVRSVFDRMLATNEQIKETELARSFEPMFSDLRAAGMTPEEWQQYQEMGLKATQDAVTGLESRAMRDMKFMSNARSRALKDLQREAAGRRREVRDQVTKEIMREPVNQVREFVTKGKFELPENASKEMRRLAVETGLGSTKMSLPALKEMYGEEANAPWRYFNTGKYGEVGTDGLHPDVVADMFGFSSGDELVRALLESEKPADLIPALTDQRMLEKYGDLTSRESLERAADEAIHNEVRSRFVATELNALQRATGGRKILAQAAKRFAEETINRLKIREIQPGRYTAAESRAARAAEKALRGGDLNAAAVEKRNQLIQNYAARAAHQGLVEVEKAVRYFNKFDREGTRENVDASSMEQIDTLLERFDLRKGQTLKAIDKRKSLLAWKTEQEDLGIEPEIPQELLDEAMRKSYKDMTLEEIRGLRDTIKQIEHLGRLKTKLLTAKDQREFQATVDAMVASINLHSGGRVVDNRTRATRQDQVARLFKGFVASHRKIASLSRELDGFKDGGPVWETIIRSMNEAGDKEASMREKATKDLAKLIKPLLEGGKMGGKGRYFSTINKSLNREERIGIALNTGNMGNMQRLLDGEGWTLDQIRPVLDTLTREDWDFVQSVWDFFEKFRPEIGAKERRVYGKEPDWVEPNPVQTRYGEYRGGYYPIKYDTRLSIAAEQHSDAEFAKQQMKGAYTTATTRRSFTKSRADEVKNRPLLYSMDGLYSGVNEVIHDLSWHEWLIDANRLLRSKSLDNAIRTGYGAEVVQQFKTAVRDIAGGEMPSGTAFEKGIGDLRAGAMVAGLGLNIVNSIINTTGITNSIVRIGPRWVAQGVGKFAQNPRELIKDVHEKSEFMRLRSKTMLRELNELQSLVRGKSRARSAMDTMMFAPLTLTQMAVDTPVWWGAYQKALAEGNSEERAVSLADQAVLDSQSGGQIKDLAAIQRGGPIQKLFTTFYGYFNAVYNIGVEQTKATNFRDPTSVLKLGGDYLMLYTIPVLFGTLIKAALMGDDDAFEPEKLAKTLANEQLSYLMGQMVGLREVTGAVQTMVGTNPYQAEYNGPAGLRFFNDFYNLATQIRQGEADEALRKSIINVLGIFFKLPASQLNRTIGGVEALIDGDTSNPAAVFAGPPKK